MAEGRREWTIYVCPVCGDTASGIRWHERNAVCGGFNRAHNPAKMESRVVAEVGVSPEEEPGTSVDYERGVEDGLAWARGGPEPPCGAEADRPNPVGLSREEIEALAAITTTYSSGVSGTRHWDHFVSARAKLRAYLGGTDDAGR